VPDRRWDRGGDEGGRDEEAGRVQPEHLDGAEARHEESRERRADEDGAAVDPLADPGRPLDPHVRELGDVGEQRAAGGRAGRVEERAEEDERVERGQRERVERVEERDLARSAITLAARKPSRSTSAPPRRPATIGGRKAKKPTRPASVGRPVSWSTNHGMATNALTLPTSETASAAKSA
jgi:hypothetical protein